MSGEPLVGGAPAITLRAGRQSGRPGIVEATVLPGRGFMLLQAIAANADGGLRQLIHAPSVAVAATELSGGPQDFAGNRSFAFGGAILAPFANRLRGRALPDAREIETEVGGQSVRLPRNWGGRAPGAESYAMHGLILDRRVPFEPDGETAVRGRLSGFGAAWPGDLELSFEWRLVAGGLRLRLEARNAGATSAPFGAGWHPYFRVHGARRDARLTAPASLRAEVNNYDEVLPTGRLVDVAGTPYDFRRSRPLGDLYLDDCFTGLPPGPLEVELVEPAVGYGVRITTAAPPVRAVQVYAPPAEGFVVIEPQFNLADPFGAAWPADVGTGMVWLRPKQSTAYEVTLAAFDA